MMIKCIGVISAAAVGLMLAPSSWAGHDQRSQSSRSSQGYSQQQDYGSGKQGRYGYPGERSRSMSESGYSSQSRSGQQQDYGYRNQGRYGYQGERSRSMSEPGYSSQSRSGQAAKVIDGKIDSFRRVTVRNNRGERADNTLAKLQLQSGRTAIVDLGPTKQLSRLNFRPGDRIQVRGHYEQVGNRQVVIAQQVKIDDTVTQIRRGMSGTAGTDRTRSGYSSRTRGQAMHELTGTIEGFRHVDLRDSRGQRGKHSLVRVHLNDGRTVVVDLGPKTRLDRLNLRKGEQITVRARPGTIDGRSVLIAQQVNRGQQRAGEQARFQQRRSQRQQTPVNLSGQIDGFRHVNLRSTQADRDQHSLVRVKLQSGRTAVVDLGPKKDLDDLNLQKGKQINIQGRRGTVDGRSVVLADQIRVGSNTIDIQRRSPTGQGGDSFTVKGTVQGYDLLTLVSGSQSVAALNLHLLDGRSVLIDAGKKYTVGEFNLRSLNLGDAVTIEGRRQTIDGQPVLVVESLRFDRGTRGGGEREYVREKTQKSGSEQGDRYDRQRQQSNRSSESGSAQKQQKQQKDKTK